MSEIIGRCMVSMELFGVQAPDSGNMELLAHGADRCAEAALDVSQPARRDLQRVRAHRTIPRRRRPDRHRHHRRARRRGLGHQRPQVVHHQRLLRRHHLGGRRDRSRRAGRTGTPRSSSFRRERRAWRSFATFPRWRIPTRSSAGAATTPRSCSPTAASRPITWSVRAAGAFVLAQQRLGGGRIHHAMRWLGQAQRALDIMGERAVSRRSHGRLLGEHQMVQDYIALSHTEIQAARLLTFQTAWKMDRFGAARCEPNWGWSRRTCPRWCWPSSTAPSRSVARWAIPGTCPSSRGIG